MSTVEALKKISEKTNADGVKASGDSISEVLESMAETLNIKSVKSIELFKASGEISGGEITFTDGSKTKIKISKK